ncbi:hypothetical protein Agub_g7568 [Astrephomene gubernaculifera]|uniref:HTH La-type RNA-binding domain-containing protein n=1 Tax=Astrephomene gubernaculifera TaxID=47775 RepID=A0AAD3HMG3_9CHLO|nr:hypothetical protein Agub_g7568 [Astrephomene gubernaculifera]
MSEPKPSLAAGSEDAEVFISASEDEASQQEITPELLSSLVKQVEFYFSDANLPTDKKLLKQIRKDPDGYVPVKLFANFRKVRALSKDVAVITDALRGATQLQLSEDGKRVRRIVAVPEYDITDIQRRTIVVENLPGNPSPTIESVTDMFRMYGRVKLVRICSRESKGKLPSWLTSSCQNMIGQQHAYVEFEEEEGAILASAALAQECDAPDGVVQVRRLLACIAEQRERRSNGNGSSCGGGSNIGSSSRKGSRDVSPLGSRAGGSRRNSSGGMSYGTSYGSHSCGGGSWTCTSSGGGASLAADSYHHGYHHHTYGGAYEQVGSGSACQRRNSTAGGAVSPRGLPPPPPPPPPPQRRSCDSAPPSEMAPSAANSNGGSSLGGSSGGGNNSAVGDLRARLNIYRPPAKRLSDGYNPPIPVPPVALHRQSNGSFTSNASSSYCAGGSSMASTPTCAPSSPALSSFAPSPPLPSRGASSGGGRPPAHPPLPPPPPPSSKSQATEAILAASSPMAPSSATAANALAEAIAQAQAERRASEAGASAFREISVTAVAPTAPAASIAAVNAAVASTAAPPPPRPTSGTTAPKFCFDLGVGSSTSAAAAPSSSGQLVRSNSSIDGSNTNSSKGTGNAVPAGTKAHGSSCGGAIATAPLPRGGTQAQMVANVEDFINNILARPAARPIPAPAAAAAAVAAAAAAQQRKTAATPSSSSSFAVPAVKSSGSSFTSTSSQQSWSQPSSARAPQQQQLQQQPLDAAAAVAGILASALRRPAGPPPAPTAPKTAAAPSNASSNTASAAGTPRAAPFSAPLVFLTAMTTADGEDIPTEELLANAVTVTVHHSGSSKKAAGAAVVPSAGVQAPVIPADLPPIKVAAAVAAAATATTTSTGSASMSEGNAASAGSSLTSSPRQGLYNGYANSNNGFSSNGAGRAMNHQPGSKRLTRREYAQWAAATPNFRAEAASKYGNVVVAAASAGMNNSSNSAGGSAGYVHSRCSAGGAAPAAAAGAPACGGGADVNSPSALASISDGGAAGVACHSGAPPQQGAGSGASAAIWHVARGPDGSRGFGARIRA